MFKNAKFAKFEIYAKILNSETNPSKTSVDYARVIEISVEKIRYSYNSPMKLIYEKKNSAGNKSVRMLKPGLQVFRFDL